MMGEYDAGYENCIDAMVRQMEDMQYRIDCLHAENAELHAELTDLRLMSCPSCGIKVENEQLRELVMIAVKYCDSGTCDECPIMGEDESCPYSDIARDLGVEVDE